MSLRTEGILDGCPLGYGNICDFPPQVIEILMTPGDRVGKPVALLFLGKK
jgi:hypothetical protein